MSVDYAKVVKLLKQGKSINSIASLCSCKWETVSRIRERCLEVWDDISLIPSDISSDALKESINCQKGSVADENILQPDTEAVLEKQRKEHLTRNELWSDYAAEASAKGLNAYSLSRFNEIVTGFARKHDVSVMQKKNPGIEAQVDWVGDKAIIIDGDTGEKTELHLSS